MIVFSSIFLIFLDWMGRGDSIFLLKQDWQETSFPKYMQACKLQSFRWRNETSKNINRKEISKVKRKQWNPSKNELFYINVFFTVTSPFSHLQLSSLYMYFS